MTMCWWTVTDDRDCLAGRLEERISLRRRMVNDNYRHEWTRFAVHCCTYKLTAKRGAPALKNTRAGEAHLYLGNAIN